MHEDILKSDYYKHSFNKQGFAGAQNNRYSSHKKTVKTV